MYEHLVMCTSDTHRTANFLNASDRAVYEAGKVYFNIIYLFNLDLDLKQTVFLCVYGVFHCINMVYMGIWIR